MADTLSTLSIVAFAVAGVCLVFAIFFWFAFKIPAVIGDLTGRTARKSIAKMRAANENTGTKTYKTNKTNAERGKLTGTMPESSKISKKKKDEEDQRPETGLLADNKAETFDSEATGVLKSEETQCLESEATGLLVDEAVTAALTSSLQQPVRRTGGKKLVMIDEVVLIHTDEVIGC